MFSYQAYGLGIVSDFPVPEFLPSAQSTGDVVIRLDRHGPPPHTLAEDAYFKVQAGEAILAYKRAGVFSVRNGREITITPAPGADHSLLRLYLVGKVLAMLLYQRGFLVLHGSAVEVDGQAVCFMGACCFGKSSLAASLHRSGCRVIADDVIAVDLSASPPCAIPGFPQVKVHPGVASMLGYEADTLAVLHPLEPRRGLRVTRGFETTPAPLGLIYVLVPDEMASEPLSSQDLLIELIRHSFPARLNHSGGAPHLLQCTRMIKLAPVRRLGREESRAPSSELMRRIRQDLANVVRSQMSEATT
jgi:hypothetical protein